MEKGRNLLAVAVWMALLWLAQAGLLAQQAPVQPGGQTFRYRFEAGTQAKYRVTAQMSGTLPLFGGLPVEKMSLDMTVALKVQRIRPDGNAELGVDVEAFRAEMDGQALPLPLERLRASLRDLVMVVTPRGEVLERKGGSVLPLQVPIPGVEASQLPLLVLQLVFPTEPLSPQQEWSYSRAMTAAAGDPPAQFTARWVQDETVDDISASRFHQKMRWSRSFRADIFDLPTTDESLMVKQVEQSVNGEAQIWFHRTEGRLLRAVLDAQYEQRTRLLNPPEGSAPPALARLTAKVQVTREELAARNSQPKPNEPQ
ncbi:MAG: hypothetical protein RMK92_10705 [Armatimonadota bacterium]|nr:hypothetical protein [Armatimonadota bacterium]